MDQHMSFSVKPVSARWTPFIISAVYASPNSNHRTQLWHALKSMATSHITAADPWLLVGDFNSLLLPQDKQGGRWDPRSGGNRHFQNFMDEVNLTDLGFVGPPFTWSNNRSPPNRILERLDRGLGNLSWERHYGDYTMHHLPRMGSDHCLLLLQNSSRTHRNNPQFRFENMWLLQPGFHMVVENSLLQVSPNSPSFSSKLNRVTVAIQRWRKSIFGSVFADLLRLKRRITGIQNSRQYQQSSFLHQLESELQHQYSLKRLQHEIFWRQRSRIQWLKEGDQNIKFYHRVSRANFKRNHIHHLVDDQGQTITDTASLSGLCKSFFHKLFSEQDSPAPGTNTLAPALQPVLTVADNTMIMAVPSEEEINKMAQDFFCMGRLDPAANETNIILLPKRDGASKLEDFRPISLCNVRYKIISQLLVTRIGPLMSRCISDIQEAFIQVRRPTENILIAKELLTQEKKYCAVKLDIKKAYDKLSWTFLRDCLLHMGFNHSITDRILTCVSTVTYRVMINGHLTELIKPEQGLRQGDPLSFPVHHLC